MIKFSEINKKYINRKLVILQEFKDYCQNVINLIRKKAT